MSRRCSGPKSKLKNCLRLGMLKEQFNISYWLSCREFTLSSVSCTTIIMLVCLGVGEKSSGPTIVTYLGVCFTLMNHHLHCELWRHLCANNSVEKRQKSPISEPVICTNYPTDSWILWKCQLTFLWKEYSLLTLEGSADRPEEWGRLWAGEVGQPEAKNYSCYL